MWPTKYGILLEKAQMQPIPTRSRSFGSMEASRLSSQNDSLPVTFSLMHPLDEICPLLMKNGNYIRNLIAI